MNDFNLLYKVMPEARENGHAERFTEDTGIENKWCIPHHGIYNPHKQKIRVVFDCSAKAGGISLNLLLPTTTYFSLGLYSLTRLLQFCSVSGNILLD